MGHSRSGCRGRGNMRFPRVVLCKVTQVHDPSRLLVHNLEAIAFIVVSKIQENTRAHLGVYFAPLWNAMVRRLTERRDQHQRADPEEHFVRGKHVVVRRGRGAVEPLGCP